MRSKESLGSWLQRDHVLHELQSDGHDKKEIDMSAILTNLKNWSWIAGKFPLPETDAPEVIRALERDQAEDVRIMDGKCYCPSCGNDVKILDRYCRFCGKRFEKGAEA